MDAATDNSTATLKPQRITDSPWFWGMLFSCVSLIGMQLLDWKYNQVQSRLERQFQGREWAAQHGAHVQMNPGVSTERAERVPVVADQRPGAAVPPRGEPTPGGRENPAANLSTPPAYSQPGRLVISLLPLRIVAFAALVVSSFLLWRKTQLNFPSMEKPTP